MTADDARALLKDLMFRDLWLPEHDEACAVLGLDPDNYRARDNDNWPSNQRGRVTFDTGQSILDHADKAKKVTT